MSINAIPVPDEAAYQSEAKGSDTFTLAWKVTTDENNPSIAAIRDACGVSIGDSGTSNTKCTAIRVRGSDSRYLYTVTADYSKPETPQKNPLLEKDKFAWSFAQTTAPAIMALASPTSNKWTKPIVNSAGDYIESASRDIAEVRLRITGNRPVFLPSLALGYGNTSNGDIYAGGAIGTWKCQGIEAAEVEAEVDDGAGGTMTLIYWQLSVELAYREEGWALRPLDIGYNEKSKTDGKVKICTPRIDKLVSAATMASNSAEAKNERNVARQMHAAADQQALGEDGTALDEFLPARALEFYVYRQVPWYGIFSDPTIT